MKNKVAFMQSYFFVLKIGKDVLLFIRKLNFSRYSFDFLAKT